MGIYGSELGVNVAPTAPKPRQVISLLMLRRNALVRVDELIDELWAGGPPTSAMTTLQTYIYKVRKILQRQNANEILETRPGGYSLRVEDSAIDLFHFEQEARTGQDLLEAGDPTQASRTLRGALERWRGQALADVERGPLLESYVTRMEELRVRTLELRINADLQRGRHHELVSELRSLVLTQPLHEHLNASLMIALRRSCRRHEALEVYRTLRTNMIDELGLEPGRELQQLHQALLADDEQLGPLDPVLEASPLTTLTAAGQEKPVTEVPRPRRRVHLSNPPEAEGDLTWRPEVLDQIRADLPSDGGGPTVVVIHGGPGLGKTTLAMHEARRLQSRYAGRQIYATLHGSRSKARSAADVLPDLLLGIGVPAADILAAGPDQAALYQSITADLEILVVLDDVADADQVRALLPAGPRGAALITSRYRLPELDGARHVWLRPLTPSEGADMLGHIVGWPRLGHDRTKVEGLVELIDGLPQAVQCLAYRLMLQPALQIDELAEQLQVSPFEVLRIGDLDVRASLERGYRRLDRLSQGVYRLLSLLPSRGFTARAVGDLLGWDSGAAHRILSDLAASHLLLECRTSTDIEDATYRFTRLALNYAREQLSCTLIDASGFNSLEWEPVGAAAWTGAD